MTDYSQTQLTALKAALASGTLRVSYDGKSVEYRTLGELREVIQIVENALAGRKPRRVFRTRASGDRGL